MISLLSDINIELLFFKVFVTHTQKKKEGKLTNLLSTFYCITILKYLLTKATKWYIVIIFQAWKKMRSY